MSSPEFIRLEHRHNDLRTLIRLQSQKVDPQEPKERKHNYIAVFNLFNIFLR
jgi:hypothetical protein